MAATYDYDAYGNFTSQTGVLQPFQFAGQYTDAESGLQYLRARYYDTATEQFLSRDPAGYTRAYVYAADSPTNLVDPAGKAPKPSPSPSAEKPPSSVEGDTSTWDFNNPKQSPGPGWQWRGAPGSKPGDVEGNWWNPKTGESLWGDLGHPPPKPPHWDYRKRGFPGKGSVGPNGQISWNTSSISTDTTVQITPEEVGVAVVVGGAIVICIIFFPEAAPAAAGLAFA